MSNKEIDRLAIIQQTQNKQIKQTDAAVKLNITVRQVKRLIKNYREHGAAGLISKRRGKPSNNKITDAIREQALTIVKQHYADFSPTFAHEKLTEKHSFSFSVETLRQWMITDNLWQPKSAKQARIHQSRPRRDCLGDLIQIDGSPHDWFEGRADKCTLIVFIDDATSQLMELFFAPTETTEAYMVTLNNYLQHHGRPVCIYSDKHSIFRVNHPDKEANLTQFSRALKTLDIEPIHANTPQAKGRVERANKTLQDRLVKELRLNNINTIEQANLYLPEFVADYNRRFSVAPKNKTNGHRKVLHNTDEISMILSIHHKRKLSKNLTFQLHNTEYQLQGYGNGYRLRKAIITACEAFNGSIRLLYEGKKLTYRKLEQGEAPIAVLDEKTVEYRVEQTKVRQLSNKNWKPAPDHPWKRSITNSTPSVPNNVGDI